MGFDGIDDLAEEREVSVVEALSPGEFPYPFDRVEVRRVWRQIVEDESFGMVLSPVTMQPSMVIAGIVGDYDHPSRSGGAGSIEGFQKDKEGSTIELVGLAMKEELAVAKPNRAKVAYAAASWMVE